MLACVGLVLAAQNTKDKQEKSNYMYYHKSFGLLSFGFLFPRVLFKVISKDPAPIVGAARWEAIAATTSHYAMYIFIIGLPFTGVFMGAYSGYGLPFFYTTIPSIQKEPTIAKKAYEIHKVLGQAFEYFVPLHVGGAFYHVIKGHTIFPRIIGVAGKAAPKA